MNVYLIYLAVTLSLLGLFSVAAASFENNVTQLASASNVDYYNHHALNNALSARSHSRVIGILSEDRKFDFDPKRSQPLTWSYINSDRQMTDVLLTYGSPELVEKMVENFSFFDLSFLYKNMLNYESRLKLIRPYNNFCFRIVTLVNDDLEGAQKTFSYEKPSIEHLIHYLSNYSDRMNKCATLITEMILSSNEEDRAKALELAIQNSLIDLIEKLVEKNGKIDVDF